MAILDRSAYAGIEVGVKATGAAGVDALRRAMVDAKTDYAAFLQQLRSGGPITAQQVRELADLKAAFDRAAESFAAGQRVMAGKAADATANLRGLGQAVQELGRGFQDVQLGGIAGGINNLSPAVMGLASAMKFSTPAVQAIGAAVDITASSLYALYLNWDKARSFFSDGLEPKLTADLKEVTKQADELRKISADKLTLIDVTDLENADRMVEKLSRIEAGVKRLQGVSDDENKRGKIVGEAVQNSGGFDKVLKAVTDASAPPETPEAAAARKQIEDYERRIEDANNQGLENTATSLAFELKRFKTTRPGQAAVERMNRTTAVRGMLGQAGSGDENARRELASIYDRNRQRFEDNGVTFRFRQGLEDAAPLNLHKEEQEKLAKDAEKDWRQDRDKAIREAVAGTKRGFDDASADSIQSAIQAGTSPEDAKRAALAVILPALKARGIGKSIVEAVADEIVGDAADAAQNRINEGQKSALQIRRDQAKTKADNEREQEINRHVAAARGGYSDEAESSIYRGLVAGGDADALQRGQLPDLTKALRDRGNIPETLVEDVARKILASAAEKAMSDLDSGQAPKLIRQAQTKQDAADKKQVHDLGPAYLDYAENLLARNRLAARSGAPIARSEAEIQRYRRANVDFALPEGEMRRRVGADLAQGLRNTGQDPALAGPMMKEAVDKLGDSVSKSMATGPNETQALIGVIHDLADQFGQLQQHVANSAGVHAGAIQSLQKKTRQLGQRTGQLRDFSRRLGSQAQSYTPF